MLFTIVLFLLFATGFAFAQEYEETSLSETIKDPTAHRILEIRGAIPVFPYLTTHGAAQSFVVGVSNVFGEIFTPDNDFDGTTPKFATDINLTFFPPFMEYKVGFMVGAVIDSWNSTMVRNGKSEDDTLFMNFYYIGFHADYGHWLISRYGGRISLYGEVSIGWMHYKDAEDTQNSFCFDVCPFGIQFCPQKNIGLYLEIPHIGARPFLQVGVTLGL